MTDREQPVRRTELSARETVLTVWIEDPHAYRSFQVYSVTDDGRNLPHQGGGAAASHHPRQRGDQNFEQTKLTTTKLPTSSEQTTR